MFTKRIIPCLDVNNGRVVKGINFINLRDAGDPVEVAAASIRDGKPVPMEMSIQSPLFTTRAASSAVHSLRLYSAV